MSAAEPAPAPAPTVAPEPAPEPVPETQFVVDEEQEGNRAAPTVTRMSKSVLTGPLPRVRIVSPRQDQVVRGNVTVQLGLERWTVAPAPGNHVVLKVDDQEGIVVRDVRGRIDLGALYRARFEEDIPDGPHLLRVYLARANHESVKIPGAFAMVVFHVGRRGTLEGFDRNAPLLTYHRPQGCASDPTRLLDFVITNLNDLTDTGYRVRFSIDDVHRGVITDWAPYRIDDLGPNEHRVRLTLLRPDGQPAPGRFNDVTRTIRGDNSCPALGILPGEPDDEDDEPL